MFLDDITKSLCSLVSLDDSIKKNKRCPINKELKLKVVKWKIQMTNK